jgi:hypothetical protein
MLPASTWAAIASFDEVTVAVSNTDIANADAEALVLSTERL